MVNACHIDPWVEADTWRFLRVIFITEELQLINTTFMYWLQKKCNKEENNKTGNLEEHFAE